MTSILTPVAGAVVPLDQVADAVFSSGALGPGAGVLPESGTVVAPLAGTIVSAMPHAYGIRSDDGIELLVHVGIDTVELEGAHFAPAVTQGERIEAGAPLVEAAFDGIRTAGYDTTVIVVLTNAHTFGAVAPADLARVDAGDTLLTVAN